MLPKSLAEDETALVLDQRVPGSVTGGATMADGPALTIAPDHIATVCRVLKETAAFERLSAITGVDWRPHEPRFEIGDFLHSFSKNARLRLSVRVGEEDSLDSVTSVWRGANWYEREVFDLFGVKFRNHPNLERIVMPADYEGYPLRKDYPIHGHKYSYQDE